MGLGKRSSLWRFGVTVKNMVTIISYSEWKQKQAQHLDAVKPFTESFRFRRDRGTTHPIYDFLFTYYPHSPKKLELWHPGADSSVEMLSPNQTHPLEHDTLYRKKQGQLSLDFSKLKERDLKLFHWVIDICETTLNREPRFGCYGLHEWAMVYKNSEVRHQSPLRLNLSDITTFIDRSTIVCSHFDAFRFFSPAATSLNILQPTFDQRLKNEQSGCVHANMDLYKWAFKVSPWISSDIVQKCFLLAVAARELDMRASPYDFSSIGFTPVKVETTEGQKEYKELQYGIFEKSVPLRVALLKAVKNILDFFKN
jgi:hypothetical protein